MKQEYSSERWNATVAGVRPSGSWKVWKVSLGVFIFSLIFNNLTNAQIGGEHVFEFLQLPNSARTTALGGSLIAVRDWDQTLGLDNPALLNKKMDKSLSFNHNFHFSDIINGYASYAQYVPKWDITAHVGIQYISYGDFVLADEFGNVQGSFKANELAFVIGAGKQFNERMSVGLNLKLVTSNLESYNSFGIAADIGGVYWSQDESFHFSTAIKNIGGQISPYVPDQYESLPFNLQVGISKRLKYLPFRFSVTVNNLQQWDLRYDDPNIEGGSLLFPGESDDATRFEIELDNFFRHFIFSGEFLLGKNENVMLRFGYNHQRKKELSVATARSLAGFSGGFGLRINKFRLDFGLGVYHIAGSVKHLSVSTNINRFKKNDIID